MSEKSANFIIPFVSQTGLFRGVMKMAYDPQISNNLKNQIGVVDISRFRQMPINFYSTDIRAWPYAMSSYHLKRDFSEDLFSSLFEGDERAKGKLLFTLTERVNPLGLNHKNALLKYAKNDSLGFIGTDKEYSRACELIGCDAKEMPRFEIEDAADCAKLMKGAVGVVGNQGGLYSLAEMLKVPRLLLSPQYMQLPNGMIAIGPANQVPIGGKWCDLVYCDHQYSSLVDDLFHQRIL